MLRACPQLLDTAARHRQLPTSSIWSERRTLLCLAPHLPFPAFSSVHFHFVPLLLLYFLAFSFFVKSLAYDEYNATLNIRPKAAESNRALESLKMG